ncbi:ribosome-binding factor A [Candidatus Parcubacteria bacterium]|nr:ribosome-binding factor A [Candidatus Parcubacteria bacterium]
MSIQDEKIIELVKNLAAKFLQHESNLTSMITVTGADLRSKGRESTIFITVFPTDKEEDALQFAKRMRSDFRDYVKENSRMRTIPFFDFEIDLGEKNRQRIDELSNQ